MSDRLKDRVAVITGGANGIGRATVLRFLQEGARVVFSDLNEETSRETLAAATSAGLASNVRFVRGDVSCEADIEAAVQCAVKDFGGLDVIFNNAGVAGAIGPITHISVEDWDYTFHVLVRGVFLGMKHAARVMKEQGRGGSIISTASVAGMSGGDGPQAYSACKAAVINLTRAVAVELAADRIRVNCICPGGILTPLIHRGSPDALRPLLEKIQPWPEAGLPEWIASAALFLASEDAHFVTGESLVVDGGLTAQGSRAVRNLGQESTMKMVGVDRGTTGYEMTLRTID